VLTLFTIPKPFEGDARAAQLNALRTWRALGPDVDIIVFGDEPGAADAAREVGARHVPELARTEWGTPLVSDAFAAAARLADTERLCYANADMILLPDLLAAARRVQRPALLVGLRVGLTIDGELDLGPGWEERLWHRAATAGTLGFERQIDYMLFPRDTPWEMPPFAVGRPGWDNWLLRRARELDLALVDATKVVLAIHQDHGYGHVPESRGARWQGPEADMNAAHLDRRHWHGINDATHVLTERRLLPALGRRHLKRRARRHPLLSRGVARIEAVLRR
jgi:hypothetical protein